MKSLVLVRDLLEKGIHKARHLAPSVAPTYFIHRVTTYELTGGSDPVGKPYIRVKGFQAEAIPPFLEGAVRGMMISSREDIQVLYKNLRNSDLFDHKLGLFKVNAPLTSQSHEIGRIRAFTPGWLENESIWMHMAFKYLLELQKAGLYEDFFCELRNHLPAFMDSEVYGRSPLENSSFIVSSAHPDGSIHGNGFVARLSGSTAELLSMWVNMTAGRQPFRVENKELVLELKPTLPGWLFKEDGTFRFNFLGSCAVTLHNPGKLNTCEANVKIKHVTLRFESDSWEFSDGVIPSPYAGQIRNGERCSIEIYF